MISRHSLRIAANKALDPVYHALNPVLSPMRPGNLAMFHIGRCGSTVLGQLLNQHPRIYWASELYDPVFGGCKQQTSGEGAREDAISCLKGDMKKALHRFYGFETKLFHLRLMDYPADSFIEQLDSAGFSHYILLDRNNRLRKIVSSLIAHQKDTKFHIKKGVKAQLTKVHININNVEIDRDSKHLLDYLTSYDRDMLALKSLLKGKKTLALSYEQDIKENPLGAYSKICDFIGLETANPSVKLARTNPFPLKDMVDNFDELGEALCGTPYEWMLED